MFLQRFRTFKGILTGLLPLLICCSGPARQQSDFLLDRDDPTGDMVFIAAGVCAIGSDEHEAKNDEMPRHTVYLSAFYIDRHEVTNIEYQQFVLATGHPPPFVDRPWAEPYNWKGTAYPDGAGCLPVVLVSWHDAQAYAQWAGKRLPTEAEWEKASRGGLVNLKYPFANDLELHQANFDKGLIRRKRLLPVGSFKPNGYGLYDTAGNVWEWCQDWYDEDYYKISSNQNPPGPEQGLYRVLRGGSWLNDKKFLRCSQRGKNVPEYKSYTLGFRCALSTDRT